MTCARIFSSRQSLLTLILFFSFYCGGLTAQTADSSAATPPSAQVQFLGVNGFSPDGIPLPVLQSPRPVLGTSVLITLKGATPKSTGFLVISALASTPLVLGSGQTVWLDLGSSPWLVLPYVADVSGFCTLSLPLPLKAGLAGWRMGVQAMSLSQGSLELSSGLRWDLGY